MRYVCVDRGSSRCPCHLMAAGQCYSCTMVSLGRCDCQAAAGWQGSCPYVEYRQRGGHVAENHAVSLQVVVRTVYSGDLVVVEAAGPPGFIEACRRPGAFVLAEASGWRTPLSVLRTDRRQGLVSFGIRPLGPKSRALAGLPALDAASGALAASSGVLAASDFAGSAVPPASGVPAPSDFAGNAAALASGAPAASDFASNAAPSADAPSGSAAGSLTAGDSAALDAASGAPAASSGVPATSDSAAGSLTASDSAAWTAWGPRYNGLLHLETLDTARPTLAVGRGSAVAPLIHLMDVMALPDLTFYLDRSHLPEPFLGRYMAGVPWEDANLEDENSLYAVRERVRQAVRARDKNVLLLTSPYYVDRLLEGLSAEEAARAIVSNSANMCCGEGLCGACSYTDRDGVTVRLCKCSSQGVQYR